MNEKGKVFLIQMPLAGREPPIAMAQLSAYLREQGLESEVMDVSIALYHRHKSPGSNLWAQETATIWGDKNVPDEVMEAHQDWIQSEYLERIVSEDKPVAGFSVSSCSFPSSLLMARWIKERRPDALVVFGGQIFATNPGTVSTIMRCAQVDAVVVGDGEHTLVDLIGRHRSGRPLACRGAHVRDAEGKTVFAGPRPPVDLDSLPFADFSDYDISLYDSPHTRAQDLLLMTNRGCVRRCSFCGHRTAWNGFRQMSGERVHAEIAHQRKTLPHISYPESEIKFYDLLVNGDMKKLGRLCDLLIADSAPPLRWKECNAVIRPEMSYEFCKKLYAAGCRILIIGIESGSQKVLDSMGKGQTVEQMKTVLKNIDRAGLQTRGNFMFGHPEETEEDFKLTLEFLKEMHPTIHYVYPSYTLTHLDGRLLQNPEQWGIAPGQDAMYWKSRDGLSSYPVRLERFKAFRELAVSLGMMLLDGLEMSLDAYVAFSLAGYYEAQGRRAEALTQYRKYLAEDPTNEFALGKLSELQPKPGHEASPQALR